MADAGVPPGLKALAPILKHAAQLRGAVPVMSYLCSLYAVQLGLKLKGTDPANKTFLLGLMERLETQRAELGSALPQAPEQKTFATNFALKVLGHADDEYRAGLATRETARNFYAAAVFFDVLKQFDDPLPEDIEEMRKYAKYSAVQITKAIKEGRPAIHHDSNNEMSGAEGFDSLDGQAGTWHSEGFPTLGMSSPSSTIQSQPGFPSVSTLGMPTTTSAGGLDSKFDGFDPHGPPPKADTFSTSPISPQFPSQFPSTFPSTHGFSPSNNHYVPPSQPSILPPPDIEQLLSLFPTVPVTSSSTSQGSSNSTFNSPNMNWTPTAFPPSHPPVSPSVTPHTTVQPQAQPRVNSTIPSSTPNVGSSVPSQIANVASSSATATATSTANSVDGFTPSPEAIEKAQKCARFATSALQFEDLPYAVQNLKQALTLLTGKKYE